MHVCHSAIIIECQNNYNTKRIRRFLLYIELFVGLYTPYNPKSPSCSIMLNYLDVYLYVGMYACMYVCMYVYIHAYIHVLRSLPRDLSSSFYKLLKTLLFGRAWAGSASE